tara:strand:+ start:66 stop:281 length:216 start_codon:yes stop_codon:yes gene_type:complete
MKAVGDWVVMKKDEGVSASGIITSADNIGLVIDCLCDTDIIGKRVCYDMASGRKKDEYIFVPYDKVYGVLE